MLSQSERRALAVIEEHLRASEPDLALSLERFEPLARPGRRRVFRAAGPVGLLLSCVLLALAFSTHNSNVLLLAAVVMVTSVVWWALPAMFMLTRPGNPAAGDPRRQ